MRTSAFELEQRCIVNRRLIDLARVLRDQFANHLQMAELLHRNVLQHVADASIFDMEGLHPILQGGGKFASRAAKLLH